MLLSDTGYRKYEPEECALIEYGARKLADTVEDHGDEIGTGVEEFDRMEVNEKLIALHTLCQRAGSDERPENRELWLDATLMAVLVMLESQVEMAFDFVEVDKTTENRQALRDLAHLILTSYVAAHWNAEEASQAAPKDRSALDEALLKTPEGAPTNVPFTQQTLNEILEGYRTSFFYDYDFQGAEQALDLPTEAHGVLNAMMGTSLSYQIDTAPSCPPQAVKAARAFFFGESA